MSNDFAVDPQASEVDLPEAWRERMRRVRRLREWKGGQLSEEDVGPLIAQLREERSWTSS